MKNGVQLYNSQTCIFSDFVVNKVRKEKWQEHVHMLSKKNINILTFSKFNFKRLYFCVLKFNLVLIINIYYSQNKHDDMQSKHD